jgi:hypothetical protein
MHGAADFYSATPDTRLSGPVAWTERVAVREDTPGGACASFTRGPGHLRDGRALCVLLRHSAVAPGSLARLPQPVLDLGDRLRPWQASDAPAVAAAYSEPCVQRWHARSMTEDAARAWIDSWPDRWNEESGGGWAMASAAGPLR